VWVTSDNQSQKLQPQPALSFSARSSSGVNTIFVDESQKYQTIEGFGASFTDSAAYLLNQKVQTSQLDGLMISLFDRTNGIGVSFVRNPMGASDLARSIYSYDDLNAGQTDPDLASFSISHDMADIVPLVRKAKQINPQLKVMASPWSPPGWMKTSGSMIGGALRSPAYASFADYFVKYVKAYAAEGMPIDYISLQNEPLFVPGDYPGMSMDAATQTILLRDYVLPALSANNLGTRVLVYDHNWDRPDYPDAVLSDPVLKNSPQIAGIAWHGYGGTPGVMTTLHNKYPDKGNYQTEHSGGTWIPDQVKADFEEITQVMRNWGKAYVKWGLVLDQNRGPHTGGCGTCNPLVTVNSSGSGDI
jgi:glucosylceramidase